MLNQHYLANLFTPADKHLMPKRRHELDWLRILLFALLIVHHIGMFYVENWGWHAKSQYQFQWLESVLLIVEPWRMPAIWLISGIAIRFVIAKVSIWRYVGLRSYRLLFPLLFGVLIIVPPQLYIEMTAKGEIAMNYWQFLQAFFSENDVIFTNYQYGIWPHIDVNHLWYLRSLWYYSLYLIVLMPLLNSQLFCNLIDRLSKLHGAFIITIFIVPVALIQLFCDINTARYPLGFTFLLYGYILGWHPILWHKIQDAYKNLGLTYVLVSVLFISFYNLVWLEVIAGEQVAEPLLILGMIGYAITRVIGLLAVLSLTRFIRPAPSKRLAYFNDAVYPFYILHQSLIIVIGYYLTQLSLGALAEAALLVVLTVTACFLGFEIIRRSEVLRPCFGLKLNKTYSPQTKKLGYLASAAALSPLILRLL